MTTGPLYHPAWHIPFQLELMARSYLLGQSMVVADMGLGKTHVGMGLAAYAVMQGRGDVVVIVCEKNKLRDWRDEIKAHTSLGPVIMYYGPDRAKRLAKGGQVLITSYETARQDLATFASKAARKAGDGPLLTWLAARRPVLVYDEASAKLGNRSSALYKAHAHAIRTLRKRDPQLILCYLTGTPIERDYEGAYSALRLLAPGWMPKVADFEKYYGAGRDDYGRLRFRPGRMWEFAELCAPRILRKRKTDADVRDQFPSKAEIFERLDMGDSLQARLYRLCEDMAWDEDGNPREVPGLTMVLRQLAGHPQAIIEAAAAGKSQLAVLLAEEIGPRLRASPSAKTEMLIEYAQRSCDEDAKLVAFTFFGQSVLPVLARELAREGFPLFIVHGAMTEKAQHEERQRFRTVRGGAVLLSSDAGARGVNLPEASTVVEYESGLTSATRQQRFDRAHRIGHGGTPLLCVTFVLERTIEQPLLKRALARNQMQDTLLGDEAARGDGFVTAADRRMLFACAARRRVPDTVP